MPSLPLPILLIATAMTGCSGDPPIPARTPPGLAIKRPDSSHAGLVRFPRQLPAGAHLTGQVPPGSIVTANGVPLLVPADGNLAWPVPPGTTELAIRVVRPDGRVLVQRIPVEAQPSR